ncbi:MAG: hypothetical protein Ct9H300mP28_03920 [Pseudomonadota bacterium]|nr:MAG: hypothetical protein Ct9H300mP28_03920 [Pseudomonadota bacterium]
MVRSLSLGLIKEKIARNQSKIPGFGIALIGWFFRSKQDQYEKINLLIFIRPTIIRTQKDLEKVNKRASSRYRKAKNLIRYQTRYRKIWDSPNFQSKQKVLRNNFPLFTSKNEFGSHGR